MTAVQNIYLYPIDAALYNMLNSYVLDYASFFKKNINTNIHFNILEINKSDQLKREIGKAYQKCLMKDKVINIDEFYNFLFEILRIQKTSNRKKYNQLEDIYIIIDTNVSTIIGEKAVKGSLGIYLPSCKTIFLCQMSKNLLYHELSHAFNAKDHYHEKNGSPFDYSKEETARRCAPDCVMRWNTHGRFIFCSTAKEQMKIEYKNLIQELCAQRIRKHLKKYMLSHHSETHSDTNKEIIDCLNQLGGNFKNKNFHVYLDKNIVVIKQIK